MKQSLKMMGLCLMLLSTLILQAKPPLHYYEVEQGYVKYEILGGAKLTEETNLNIYGTSTLRFKEWGKIRQEEDSGIVVTTGAIHSTQKIRRLQRHTGEKVVIADYDNRQLLEHKATDQVSSLEKETAGLQQRGQEVIAGYLCKLWVGPGISKCIYKGVVLKQESHILGVSYLKKAVKATFDANLSTQECMLPSFPKKMFGMFKDHLKTQKSDSVENVCNMFKDIEHQVDADYKTFDSHLISTESKKRKAFINKITDGIFRKQKETLPALFQAMKQTRECLHKSEDILQKQVCIASYRERKTELGFTEDVYRIFDDYGVDSVERVEDAIIDFAPRMPCVKRAKNFTDLSSCMK